jgi:glycine/D-amino acid oxidase-like deaminating enzyme
MTSSYSTDIVIFGGGIAGLWLLNRLKQQGYACVLLNKGPLGGGQTLCSQGIIHGGLKYALAGSLSTASQTIAEMPARWRQLLAGEAELDLTDVKVLSEHYYMWSGADMRSKLKTFLGSKSLRGRIDPVSEAEYPEFFRQATVKGRLYRLPDFVIDSQSLIQNLHAKTDDATFNSDGYDIHFERDDSGVVRSCRLHSPEQSLQLDAQRFLFTAGSGNEALLEASGCSRTKAQRRPLNMVYLTADSLPELFVHCIGSDFSLTPRLTVTSHRADDGRVTWYLGGELAESGVGLDDARQIQRARTELGSLFPWVDSSNAEWHCLPVDRAEASTASNARPDDAFFQQENHTLAIWPTKFTLAPALADRVVDFLDEQALQRNNAADLSPIRNLLPAAVPGVCPWNN